MFISIDNLQSTSIRRINSAEQKAWVRGIIPLYFIVLTPDLWDAYAAYATVYMHTL